MATSPSRSRYPMRGHSESQHETLSKVKWDDPKLEAGEVVARLTGS